MGKSPCATALPQRVDDAHTELIFGIGSDETRMKPRVGAGVRPRVHRRCQFPTDSVCERVAPSFGKDDLSGETTETSWHSEADPYAGNVTPSCRIRDPSGGTVEAAGHPCADLSVGNFAPTFGRENLSDGTVEAPSPFLCSPFVGGSVPTIWRM